MIFFHKQYERGISTQAKEIPKAIWNYIKSKTKVKEGIGELHDISGQFLTKTTAASSQKVVKGRS
jgi:hypothetical protein